MASLVQPPKDDLQSYPSRPPTLSIASTKPPEVNTRGKHWNTILNTYADYKSTITKLMVLVFGTAYVIYFSFALAYDFDNAVDLMVLTALMFCLILAVVFKNVAGKSVYEKCGKPIIDVINTFSIIKWIVFPAFLLASLLFVCLEVIYTVEQIQALAGLALFILLPFLFSKYPAHIRSKPIVSGLCLQFLFAVFLLRYDTFFSGAEFVQEVFWKLREHAFYGAGQVFGDPFFLFHPYPMIYLPLVVFMCLLTSMLYYSGVLSLFISSVGWALRLLFGGTSVELTSILTGTVIGVSDTLLTYRPYLDLLTASEFFTFLVGAHSSRATFVNFLLAWCSVNPRHLMTCAFLNAPAAYVMAKIHYPEVEESMLKDEKPLKEKKKGDYGLVQAGSNGAWFGGKIASAFIACSIFTLSAQTLLSNIIEYLGERVGEVWSLQIVLGPIFQPVAWLMGIPWSETRPVGEVLGLKFFTDESQALLILGEMRRTNVITERSALIATFASHGTAGLGYVVVFAGVWLLMDKTGSYGNRMVSLIPSIMLCAHCAAFFSGALTGLFYTDELAMKQYKDSSNAFLRYLYADFPDYSVSLAIL